MNWNIKDSGDPFEKKCCHLIINKIKGYNDFWSRYVGNIAGKPAKIEGISYDINEKRLLIAQWNYTILRNVYATKILLKRNEKKQVKNQEDIINQEIDFLLSTHLFYNTIEIINKIKFQIDIEIKEAQHKDFIEFRNHITHNVKPLIKILNNFYHVPENFDWFLDLNMPKNKSWIWSELDSSGLKFQRLSKFFEWCFQKTLTIFNQILHEELEYFSRNLNDKKISDTIPEIKKTTNKLQPVSGTTDIGDVL